MGNLRELKVKESPKWSPSRLLVASRCMKAYWFQYVFHLEHSVNSGIAIGKLEHRMIEHFWKKDISTGALVPGYKSYQSFVNSAVRDWKFQFARTGESEGQQIDWSRYDGNGYAPWLIGRIAESMGLVYTRYLREEPRLEAEVTMEGEFEGLKIMCIADELRKDLVVRDHKSGRRKIGDFFVKYNNQLTICLMTLFKCLNSRVAGVVQDAYPEYVGIPLDEFLDIAKIEIHEISPQWRRDGMHDLVTRIHEAQRTEQDFNEVILLIESKQRALRERDFSPSKDGCDFCFFRKDCDKYNPTKYHEGEYESKFPLFANSGVFLDRKPKESKRKPRQKPFRFN